MSKVRIPAFAKINLRLDILGKRADGFHELRTIFQTISLHDELRLRASRSDGIALSIEGNQPLSAEPAEKNLVYRAVDALQRELKIRAGVEIELKKTIPAGRGLGGGSSDAAAALLGYLRLTKKNLAPARLLEIAASLGAACATAGNCRVAGRGCAVFPAGRAGSRGEQRRRNLSADGYSEIALAGSFAKRNSCAYAGCLLLAGGRTARIDKLCRNL